MSRESKTEKRHVRQAYDLTLLPMNGIVAKKPVRKKQVLVVTELLPAALVQGVDITIQELCPLILAHVH